MLQFSLNVALAWCRTALLTALMCGPVLLSAEHAAAGEVTYQYDKAGRLKRVTYPDNKSKDYKLDPAGNRTQVQALSPTGGALSFTTGSYSVSEGVGSVQLTVSRTVATAGAVALSYAAVNGSAVSGSDFTAASGTLNWGAGDGSSRTITIQITNDSILEGAEHFSIDLRNPTGGAVLGTVAQSIVDIQDNDGSALSVSAIAVSESAANASFIVTLSPASTVPHQVNYATVNGTAQGSADFNHVSGTLTFAPGQTSQTVSVPMLNDAYYEYVEAFTLTLSGATNGASITSANATASINDSSPAPVISVNDISAYEHDSSTHVFSVYRTGDYTSIDQTVNYAVVSGTATIGADFVSSTGTLTFTGGINGRYVTVQMIDDAIYEGTETFSIILSNPTNGAVVGDGQGIGTIVDNEPPPPIPPSIPTSLSATVVSHSQVNLSWHASTAQSPKTVTAYYIYRNGAFLGQSSALSFSDTGTAGSTTYSYTVAAFDSGGFLSGQSTAVSATTPPGPATIPPTPQWTTFTECGEPYGCENYTDITLTWSAAAGATYYEVEHSDDWGSNVVVQQTDGLSYFQPFSTRSFIDTYRVRACSAAGCSAYSTKLIFGVAFII